MPFLPRHAGCRTAALLTVGFLSLSALHAQEVQDGPNQKTAHAALYASPQGDTYFALVLPPSAPNEQRVTTRHVVLVDTSASQVGVHRTEAFGVLEALLNALPSTHEVALFAIDLKPVALSEGFQPVGSDALKAAHARLKARVPAGATDLAAGLTTALEQFEPGTAGSVLYIGDGMSAARLLTSADLTDVLETLHSRRVAIHSYAVGPNRDLNLLGILGTHSGGVVHFDQNANEAAVAHAGQQLATAMRITPEYPAAVELVGAEATLFPRQALPQRSDRETVYLGRGRLTPQSSLRIQHESGSHVWNIPPSESADSNAYLAALYRRAETRQVGNPLCGSALLTAAQNAFDRQVDDLIDAGVQAIAVRDADQTRQVLAAAEKLAPGDVRVRTLIDSSRRIPVKAAVAQVELPEAQNEPAPQPPQAAPPATEAPALGQPAPPATGQPAPPAPGQPATEPLQGRQGLRDVDLLAEEQRRRTVRTQRLQLEVSQAMDAVRDVAGVDPEGALNVLKSQLNAVNAATDVDPTVREMLARRLRDMVAEVRSTSEAIEIRRMAAARQAAVRDAQLRLVDQLHDEEETLERLINEVRGYISQGQHGDDNAYELAEHVAEQAVKVQPFSGAASAAQFTSEAANQLNNAFRWRALRADRFLETLEQVEISHVPFPDEPPIRWPPTAVWRALSERRKVWASVDLAKRSPREQRIEAILDDPTIIDFPETPLSEVVNYLSEQHDIPIILHPDLQESDQIVNRTLQGGISLRSALKIMLEPLELTYVIQDEVMMIVDEATAGEMFSTRVYPVGDLVVPVQSQQGGLGGAGALGGGLGGGGIGGGLGGGGLGGGGGFFSMPTPAQFRTPQAIPPQADVNTIPAAAAPKPYTVQPAEQDQLAQRAQPAEQKSSDAPVVFDNRFVTGGKKKPLSLR